MKILLFSDIHGNSSGLNELRDVIDIVNPNKIIFLGDVFGYFYNYKEVINFLTSYKIDCILGNHDKLAMDVLLRPDDDLLIQLVGKYGSGYSQLVKDKDFYLNYLENINDHLEINFDGLKYLFTHGSIEDFLNGRLYKNTPLLNFNLSNFDVLFCGHTHQRFVRYVNSKLIVNVGSCGQPRDGLKPCFVIYDTDYGSINFYDLYFDMNYLKLEVLNNFDGDKPYFNIFNRKQIL
jgi:putative phosphoesterase